MITLSVLLENETSSQDLACEHGLSLLLACDGTTVLFDTGETDACLRNALAMRADLDAVHAIVLSHGHHDHCGGLGAVLQYFTSKGQTPAVIAHPDVLRTRRAVKTAKEPGKRLSMPEHSLTALQGAPKRLTRTPLHITENLVYLGQIPRKYPETCALLGEIEGKDGYEADQIWDDSALAYVSGRGPDKALVIIAGCAHSGIINIVEHAKTVTGVTAVHAVIGGLHMKDAAKPVLDQTLRYFEGQQITVLRGCHCTGDALTASARQQPLHTGDYLEIG